MGPKLHFGSPDRNALITVGACAILLMKSKLEVSKKTLNVD